MQAQEQAKFEGWAIVEILGHQRYVGYVTTQAFGAAVLFRIDVPALPARERTTVSPEWSDKARGYLPIGTVVTEGEVQGYSKLVGAGSIYAITPCTEEAALKALERSQPRPLMSVQIPPGEPVGFLDVPDEADDDGDLEEDDADEDAEARP